MLFRSRSSPAPALSLSPLPARVWVSVPSQSFRRARPRAMRIALVNRKSSRTTRRATPHPPTRLRTPLISRRVPIPLRPTVARRPARPTQAKRLTALNRARATRRTAIHRVRDLPTTATPTARVEPRPARHLTARAKARHRVTKHVCLSKRTNLYNGREPATVAPVCLGRRGSTPRAMVRCFGV